MKTLSVAVAVAFVFAFFWIQESSAAPSTEMEKMEEPGNFEFTAELKEAEVDSQMLPYYRSREKRGIDCKFCCGCCSPGVCGFCCRF